MKSRLALVFLFVCGMWALLIARAAYLQIFPDDRLQRLKERQFSQTLTLRPQRGRIIDRKGHELAISVNSYSLFADPYLIKNPRGTAKKLAKLTGVSRKLLTKKFLQKKKRFVWVQRRLEREVYDKISAWKNPGLGFIEEPKRIYPNQHSLSQVLGMVGSDGNGLEGVEKHFDELLTGQKIEIKVQKDALGRSLINKAQILEQKVHATDVQLTIDRELQYVVERELGFAVEYFEADSGVAVVMDPDSAEILSMVSVPTFDANVPLKAKSVVRRNRAVSDFFEPGSTLKTFVIAGAIKHGTAEPNSRYFCENGRMRIGNRWIRESDSKHKWGELSVSETLVVSSNICSAKIGFDLSAEKLRSTLLDFGFGGRTGIEFPGESAGLLQDLPWRKHLLSNISFGHGVAVTPIQITNAYATIANGGKLFRPTLVKKMINTVDGDATEFSAKKIRRVLSEEQSKKMRLMLMGVTSPGGTGVDARVEGFPVAGKTGTAQKVNPNGRGYLPNAYISSFAGFIPAHDPKFVIFVALDNPRKKYYSSQVAAPVFAKIASYAVRKAGLTPILISEKNLVPPATPVVDAKRQSLLARARKELKAGTMPDLRKLTLRDVVHLANEFRLKVSAKGDGTVFDSLPNKGDKLKGTKKIRVFMR